MNGIQRLERVLCCCARALYAARALCRRLFLLHRAPFPFDAARSTSQILLYIVTFLLPQILLHVHLILFVTRALLFFILLFHSCRSFHREILRLHPLASFAVRGDFARSLLSYGKCAIDIKKKT